MLNLSEKLVQRGHKVTVTCRPGQFVEQEAKERGLLTVPITIRTQQDWSAAKSYHRLLKSESFDVVHAHWRPDYLVPATLARLHHVPAVVLSHHSPRPMKAKEVFLYPRFLYNRLIALSESVRRLLIKQGLPPDKVVTIHHGTDTAGFRRITRSADAVRVAWAVPADRIVIGIVGRIAPEKGIFYLLDAMTQTCDLPLHLVIVGDGPQEAEVRAEITRLGLWDRVTLAGFIKDVNNAMNALDILVLASTWQEPCAAVVQQAMALGKPVIGTDAGGTPEMIVDGGTGIVVPPADASAIAAALRALEADSQKRLAMGLAGHERVDSKFNQTCMVDEIEALYRSETAVLSSDPAGRALGDSRRHSS